MSEKVQISRKLVAAAVLRGRNRALDDWERSSVLAEAGRVEESGAVLLEIGALYGFILASTRQTPDVQRVLIDGVEMGRKVFEFGPEKQ